MKKNIKFLAEMLAKSRDGTLKGGFASIKGGFSPYNSTGLESTNGKCTNTVKCEKSTNSRCSK